MSHVQHIGPWFAHVIQPLPETGHSDIADRQKRCAPLFHMTGILDPLRSTALSARPAQRHSLAISLSLANLSRQEARFMLPRHLVERHPQARFP